MGTETIFLKKIKLLMQSKNLSNMYWYLGDNYDDGADYYFDPPIKCLLHTQILLWIYIYRLGTLPNSEESLESSFLLYLQ